MKRMMLMLVLSALILTGCFAHHAYETSATGKFEGAVAAILVEQHLWQQRGA